MATSDQSFLELKKQEQTSSYANFHAIIKIAKLRSTASALALDQMKAKYGKFEKELAQSADATETKHQFSKSASRRTAIFVDQKDALRRPRPENVQ